MLVWLLPTLATAAVASVTVAAASPDARTGVALCAVVGTLAVVLVAAEAARRGRAAEELRARASRREGELIRRLARQETEYLRMAKSVLPAAMTRFSAGEGLDRVVNAYALKDVTVTAEFRAAQTTLLRSVLQTVENEEAMREAAQQAFVNIARRVQAIVHRQAAELRSMEYAHGNTPAVFDDLLLLDHGNALIGRLADSIAVLGGARPGRQWNKPVPLYSVLRGGMSRILDFERIELHPVSDVAVVGPAVEPLIHAVAELLDNATRYSPPHTLVHLTAVEVQSGIAIEIEDGGLSLSEEGRARAERMLAEAQAGMDLNDLGETPRLGLAVVGRLCRAYGFQVSLRPSAYGGVRAVLVFPQRLLTSAHATGRAHGIGVTGSSGPEPVDDRRPHTSPPPRRPLTGPPPGPLGGVRIGSPAGSLNRPRNGSPNASRTGSSSGADDVPVVTEWTATGLPRRRRHTGPPVRFRSPAGSTPAGGTPTGGTPTGGAPTGGRPAGGNGAGAPPGEPAEPVQPGLWLTAFTEGINGTGPSDHGNDHTNGSGNGNDDSTGTRRDER
ncbi:ATP-binding protein [Kitasatospora sp. NPDC004723]|uniref:ATP-binding protein n=1 Tax=Kitasatospora sp. NPDC004723 TaxID=3154288 RepID=UPI0033A215BA